MTDPTRDLQALIESAVSRLEAELDSPDDIWPDHVREAVGFLEQALTSLRASRPPEEQEAQIADLELERDKLKASMIKVRAHTSYTTPTLELLQGLLASIERIADASLTQNHAPEGAPK